MATLAERLWAKVKDTSDPDGCWLWTGSTTDNGYGQIRDGTRRVLVHRLSYALAHGGTPSELQIDHVWDKGCRHRNCVNPAHLELVTNQENTKRVKAVAKYSRVETEDRRAKFVTEYLVDFNGSQAAQRAGYAKSSAKVQACKLLKLPEIRHAIAEYMRADAEAISAEWVISKLKQIVDGGLLDKDRASANRALELIGKYLRMFPSERQPGATPANPLYVAQVGYDINAVMDDPEIRAKVLELHQLIQAKTGGEGLIIEGEGGVI